MSRTWASGHISVPDELHEVLLEFTISYLLERPVNVIDYAVEYFTQLQESRQTQLIHSTETFKSTPDESPDESPEVPLVDRFSKRRKSIFTETYNPEEDEEDAGTKIVYPKSDEQRQRLSDSVRNIFLFRVLDGEQMADVLDAMFERLVKPGQYIIRQGDDGDNFYVIEKGQYEVYVKDQDTGIESMIHVYDNSGAFGELALLYKMPRAASIKAITNGTLWAMDRQVFRRILLKSAYKKRKLYEDLINKVPMLKSLEKYERMNLADALVPKQYANGENIIKQGDTADGMYFVEDGVVKITIQGDDGREIEINRVPAGGYLGELALVTHKPRAASAYAVGDVKLAFLDVEAFERLLGPCKELMKRNIDDYEDQLVKIFGSKANVTDIR
ncbi:cAMP-dependent protein kinase type II regulatory subunit isoform X1 [Augochlora pura]